MKRMTADHFVVGLFKALDERGIRTLNVRTTRVDDALHAVFEQLRPTAVDHGIDLRFRVSQNLHGESAAMREAFARTALRDEISLDNPEYTDIRFKSENLEGIVWDTLPGGRDLFVELAEQFLERYQTPSAHAAVC
jgi:hypothetical protein